MISQWLLGEKQSLCVSLSVKITAFALFFTGVFELFINERNVLNGAKKETANIVRYCVTKSRRFERDNGMQFISRSFLL